MRRRHITAMAVLLTSALVLPLTTTASAQDAGELANPLATATVPYTFDPDLGRQAVPEDRYAMASGCYAMAAPDGSFVARDVDGPTLGAVAEPLHFQATDLGEYLLFATQVDFLGGDAGVAEVLAQQQAEADDLAPVGSDTDLVDSIDDDAQDEVGGVVGTDVDTGNPTDLGPDAPSTVLGVAWTDAPGPIGDWVVEQVPGGFTFTLPAADDQHLTAAGGVLGLAAGTPTTDAVFALTTAEGCAEFPEVEVNVDGPLAASVNGYTEAVGYLDAHLHMMAFEFIGGRARCGDPWSRYGVTVALEPCEPEDESPGNQVLEVALSEGGPGDNGWPTFGDYPASGSLTYEQVYYRWMERAWRGGLRMFTNLMVENNVLCEVYPVKRNSCNEMDAVRLQVRRIRELERYIDAQSGGPGEGWFRIVTDPFEAREVVNSGRLAVVLGIEVSVLFDCGEFLGQHRCDRQQIDRQLQEVYDLGIRQMELVNKFDNALSGVTGDGGTTGGIVGQGNKYETGHNWMMETCPEDRDFDTDRRQVNPADDADQRPDELRENNTDELAALVLDTFGSTGAAPVYGPGPHCNSIGLTDLGRYAVEQMAGLGVLIDPDHQSARGVKGTLDVVEELDYSGVISSHSWAGDVAYERIYDLGGIVTGYAGGPDGFVNKYARHLQWAEDDYYFGFGYGADTNGFGGQGGPPSADGRITYPFTALGGAQVDVNTAGLRTWDFNTEGTAHYGLYADWMESLRLLGGDAMLRDMVRGAEAYLQVWERADGIERDLCHFPTGQHPAADVTAGMTPVQVLRTAGQPNERQGTTFTYCGIQDGQDVRSTVTFDDAGLVAGVVTEAADGPSPQQTRAAEQEERAAAAPDVDPDLEDERADHEHDEEAGDTATTAADVDGDNASTSITPTRMLRWTLLLAGLLGAVVVVTRRRVVATVIRGDDEPPTGS